MPVCVGSTRQPIPEIVPHRGFVTGRGDENWRNQRQSDPSRTSTRKLPPHQKRNHRQDGKAGHEPRERNARRDRKNNERAAEDPKPHQHVRSRPAQSASSDRRSCGDTGYNRNQGARQRQSPSGGVSMMASPDSVTGPINIGNPDEFTILELASQVIELTGSRSKIVHRPKPQGDPRQRRPDISRRRTSWHGRRRPP